MRVSRLLIAAALAGLPAHGFAQQGVPVFDAGAIAKHVEQIGKLTEQIKTMQAQLTQAKQLYESFNKLTDVNDVASLLGSDEFRKHLPKEFGEIEKLVSGGGGSLASVVDRYLDQNRAYQGGDANSFYRSELDRIARQTGAKHSIGQSVYDTASKRIDGLEELRQKITASKDAKDVLDLSARIQAEQALLQNEVLRMQGLAMVQQARGEMDGQRAEERRRQLVDEMKAALR
ncbi:Type IV secretion protein [Bosea sp. 62]|uniref:P-type DNA transfer protein VirB5 n=1 Tax=unclassified Bosea (in: a-proteobacteria) TaxID=2653178 RepID=UPI00125A542D|nr:MULTISPECIES: P-type DNA transfer protein VirB5 [unclassified Bosea (in: a-proteobacteria)]CAD5291952.1 Type IV secretion protein [Bosea sp. 21B]CAD5292989.1 Type IV secretion protein [Bosea sp. 46]CAD5299903.1 Type IV secretion protein [Bosea sp. 7B]VVT57073.1 Type IV secretion protein [Bosea sp. EC-HK365B]VXB48172.1 Type IV secretion protein [Bosea sp. 127]